MNNDNFFPKAWIVILLMILMISLDAVEVGAARNTSVLNPPTPPLKPQIRQAVKHDLSQPLKNSDQQLNQTGAPNPSAWPHLPLPKAQSISPALSPHAAADPVVQTSPALSASPTTDFNFEGVSNADNVLLFAGSVLPPDTNGDIGPNHYVQWVNLSMAIWELDRSNSSATLVYGPAPGNAIWSGFGGPCELTNHGDPIVLYDHLADRWLISQFSVNGPYYECIAVSATGDPTGAWHRYAFHVSDDKMNDYPKFGVWPDGYYMTANQFTGSIGNYSWAGAGVWAFERDKMLLGQEARMVYYDMASVNINFGGMLPSDLDGPPPPQGTPNYFVEVDDSTWFPPPSQDALRLWEFHVDWANPASSTFGLSGFPNQTLNVASFSPLCTYPFNTTYDCIPQPDTSEGLDAIADRLMYRLAYRNFGDHAALVTNHTVDAGGGRAGVRWYELRQDSGGWSVYQQGTYAGDGSDTEYRWMGSAAMDGDGDIALGYSAASETLYPSIRYTGRLAGDPLNSLPQGEASLIEGAGSQNHSSSRWGDYTMLSVDPTDDCTFWYTNQYYSITNSALWRTRIGSFVFPSCQAQVTGELQGVVTSGASSIEGAVVKADSFTTLTDSSGFYHFQYLPTGLYTVTAQAHGYSSQTFTDVQVNPSGVTEQDFDLSSQAPVPVSGTVTDGSGQGWPLYARLDISALDYQESIFTNPLTGVFSITLPGDTGYTFSVHAVSPGYDTASAVITPTLPSTTHDFILNVDANACLAPGYDGNCDPTQPGGLVMGNVYDGNTGASLNGASLVPENFPQYTATSFPTPDDPEVEDGFFILFSPAGEQPITASLGNYGDRTRSVSIVSGGVVSADFELPAGAPGVEPTSLTVQAAASQKLTRQITLSNTGGYPLRFNLSEVQSPLAEPEPAGPFASPSRLVSPKHLYDLNASSVYDYNPPAAGLLPAGAALSAWDSGLASPWGIGYDPVESSLWVGDAAPGGGDDSLQSFTLDGKPRGKNIPTASLEAHFSADMAYNPFTRTFWAVEVGVDNCIYEFDPRAAVLTGREVCPAFSGPQRGLAYNPLNNTYYSGSWIDGALYHFDTQGRILASYSTGLNISGLAYNPDSGHLFVLTNAEKGYDLYILDAEDGFQVLGGFDVPGLDEFQQAGLALDCSASLWTVNQTTGKVIQVDSGESSACAFNDAPWVDLTPTSGQIPPGGAQTITVDLDASKALVGLNQAAIVVTNDSPYGQLSVPVVLDVAPKWIYYLPMIRTE